MKDNPFSIPISYQNTIHQIYGDQGKIWLESLPNFINDLTNLYNLTDLKLIKNLSYNLVWQGQQNQNVCHMRNHKDKSIKIIANFLMIKEKLITLLI